MRDIAFLSIYEIRESLRELQEQRMILDSSRYGILDRKFKKSILADLDAEEARLKRKEEEILAKEENK